MADAAGAAVAVPGAAEPVASAMNDATSATLSPPPPPAPDAATNLDDHGDGGDNDLALKKSELALLPSSSDQRGCGDEDGPGNFDCNVCYDTAREPVVTMCGHLYCWPCLYR